MTGTVAGPRDKLLNKTCYHEAYIHGPVVAMTRQCVNYLMSARGKERGGKEGGEMEKKNRAGVFCF